MIISTHVLGLTPLPTLLHVYGILMHLSLGTEKTFFIASTLYHFNEETLKKTKLECIHVNHMTNQKVSEDILGSTYHKFQIL